MNDDSLYEDYGRKRPDYQDRINRRGRRLIREVAKLIYNPADIMAMLLPSVLVGDDDIPESELLEIQAQAEAIVRERRPDLAKRMDERLEQHPADASEAEREPDQPALSADDLRRASGNWSAQEPAA